MSASAATAGIKKRLVELGKYRVGIDPGEIVDIVESVMASVDGDHASISVRLHEDIEALAAYIRTARAEISNIGVDEIHSHHIPTATDELSAVVGATEQATNEIFSAVETIEQAIESMDPEMAERLTGAVTQIYEACGFQDITGQRVNKVVKTLQTVEEKVRALLDTLGQEGDGTTLDAADESRPSVPDDTSGTAEKTDEETAAMESAPSEPKQDGDLMNGPQLPGNAMSQEDIDKLLASFD